MLKRTIVIQKPSRLRIEQNQLLIDQESLHTVPLEDIGVLIVEDRQCTLSAPCLAACAEYNIALLTCNHQHLPISLSLPLSGHSTFSERARLQIAASQTLKKAIWQQLIQYKILRQANVLEYTGATSLARKSRRYASEVKPGDPDNLEARVAQYYWSTYWPDFNRSRGGEHPNSWLNYGYALLRASCARALVGSGLLPVLGVFHRNKYNPYCLADDLMEPFRPFIDWRVWNLAQEFPANENDPLPQIVKVELLKSLSITVRLDGKRSPLMTAVQHTANSLAQVYMGEKRKLRLPEFASE